MVELKHKQTIYSYISGIHKGLCVPKECDAEKKCTDFGSLDSGLLSGQCQEDNTCSYADALIIA